VGQLTKLQIIPQNKVRIDSSKIIISIPMRCTMSNTLAFSVVFCAAVVLATGAFAEEEQCYNPAGIAVGPKGMQNIRPKNTFVGTIFERKGSDNCPCSFVSFSSSLP